MTTTQDFSQLRALADAATPGPWAFGTFHRLLVVPSRDGVPDKHSAIADFGPGAMPWTDDKQAYYDAEFCAAANPATVVALLDTLKALQAHNERLIELAKQVPFTYYVPTTDKIRPFPSDGDVPLYTAAGASPGGPAKRVSATYCKKVYSVAARKGNP